MRRFYIFASVKNIYTGQVKKLKDESKVDTHVVYIEDFVENSLKYHFKKEDIIYFLCCNSELVYDAIKLLRTSESFIINERYLECDYKKYDIQNLLDNNDVPVPKVNCENNIENLNFPIFCKENRHEGIIFQSYNKITLKKFFEKFDISNFYFEDVIVGNGTIGQEEKYYYVDGKIFGKVGNIQINENVKSICKNISKALNNLEVFSVDIIQTKDNENYVIDVNPSAGFYLSNEGRKYFLDKVYNNFGRENAN